MLSSQPWDSLRPLLARTAVDVEEAIDRLRRYSALLLEWNRTISNLISRQDEARFVERHLRESLAPAGWIRQEAAGRCIDFGSGAGLPAIPLAIAGIGDRWTLVESRRPKTLFLRKAFNELGLGRCEVIHARLEEVVRSGNHQGAFDAFTSRATMRLGPTLEMATPIVRPDGFALLWKGSQREAEMIQSSSWVDHWEFRESMEIGTSGAHVAKFIRKN